MIQVFKVFVLVSLLTYKQMNLSCENKFSQISTQTITNFFIRLLYKIRIKLIT